MNRIALVILKNIFRFPGAYYKLCHYAKHTDDYSFEEKYDHIQYMFEKVISSGNVDLQVYGKENIPQEDGFILYGNHQGLFDVIAVVASCDKPLAAVLKKELCKIPLLKQVIQCTKSQPMDREDIKQSMQVIINVTKEVKEGRNYLIFPEGTRSKNGNNLLEFHSGSFKCATKSKCTIVPVAFVDSYKVLDEKGSKKLSVQIHYLEPIKYDEYKDMNTVDLSVMVHDRIQEVVNKNCVTIQT
ncbi:MAG: 1-acyl-sn-glycerol-3-phosphate acyltransferase [Lachnospiraceae bacterium]|nr:1-acyl-sn-glycerol-3-phosphate acyltransferase [Lachnospiraceae bacterium]